VGEMVSGNGAVLDLGLEEAPRFIVPRQEEIRLFSIPRSDVHQAEIADAFVMPKVGQGLEFRRDIVLKSLGRIGASAPVKKVTLFLLFNGAGDIPAVGRDQEKRVRQL